MADRVRQVEPAQGPDLSIGYVRTGRTVLSHLVHIENWCGHFSQTAVALLSGRRLAAICAASNRCKIVADNMFGKFAFLVPDIETQCAGSAIRDSPSDRQISF